MPCLAGHLYWPHSVFLNFLKILRLAIAAFIARGSLHLFLPILSRLWLEESLCATVIGLFGCIFSGRLLRDKRASYQCPCLCLIFFSLGFAWNPHYAQGCLNHLSPTDLEGKLDSFPQSNAFGAKVSISVEGMLLTLEEVVNFSESIYLSWQPAWRKPEDIPEIVP